MRPRPASVIAIMSHCGACTARPRRQRSDRSPAFRTVGLGGVASGATATALCGPSEMNFKVEETAAWQIRPTPCACNRRGDRPHKNLLLPTPPRSGSAEVWLPCDKRRTSVAEPCPPGTEFLDAETGPPKSLPETTDVPRDQKGPKPRAEIPAQTAYLSLMGKYAVRQDWVVADAVQAKPVSNSQIPCKQGILHSLQTKVTAATMPRPITSSGCSPQAKSGG